MRLHPRTRVVQAAEAEIREAVSRVWEEQGLTSIEVLQILGSQELSILKFMLRSERHPDDPDKGGDQA